MTGLEIRKMIEDIIQSGGFTINDIEERIDDVTECTVFNVRTADARHLIGRNGDVARALNHLVQKSIEQSRYVGLSEEAREEKREEYKDQRYSIDIDDYFKKYMDRIKMQVDMLVNRARSFGSDVAMEPMEPYDRMIIHSMIKKLPDISSTSYGKGKDRHIVLKYTGEQNNAGSNSTSGTSTGSPSQETHNLDDFASGKVYV